MTALRHLTLITDVFCSATGMGRGTVSAILLKRGNALEEIAAGRRDVTTRTFESAMLWLSANWPDGTAWPEDVARPFPQAEGPAVVVGGSGRGGSHDGDNGAASAQSPVNAARRDLPMTVS